LPDSRIPVLRSCEYAEKVSTPLVFDYNGFYVLTVTGKRGCECFAVSKSDIDSLIADIQDWAIDDYKKILAGTYDPNASITYDWSTAEMAIKSLGTILSQSGAIGNAYQNAPQMIRSCVWVPLNSVNFTTGFPKVLYLGNYETNVTAYAIKATPWFDSFVIDIPWKFSDWRRSVCETVYLQLPYAGLVQLGSDTLTGVSQLQIIVSVCALDGAVAYEVKASGKTIGYYGGGCSAPYAIGINQKAGLGDIIQTAIAGIEKTVSVAVDSSLSPMSALAAAGGVALEGINTAYQIANTAMTTHPSCIGSMGGAASAGLTQSMAIIVVSHDTAVAPADMAATMGRPEMAPKALSGLTGYCQCANAHVALAAQAREIDAVDFYLNSGFFIE
jgi:hypothetical protein